MAQYDWGTIDPETTSGVDLATMLDLFRDAMGTTNLGPTRPPYMKAGGLWIRSDATSLFTLLVFDGANDLEIGKFNAATDQFTAAGAVPIGGVIDWTGTVAPAGWALCDGATYSRSDGAGMITTPDLRGRFVLASAPGLTLATAGGIAFGSKISTDAGGAHSHTVNPGGAHGHGIGEAGRHSHGGGTLNHVLTVAELPPHAHAIGNRATSQNNTGNQAAGTHGNAIPDTTTAATGGGAGHNHPLAEDGTHTHPVEAAGDHSHVIPAGGPHAHTMDLPVPPFYVLAKIMRI